MRLEGLLGYLRPFDTFLASLGVILYVRIDSSPVHMLFSILLYLTLLRDGLHVDGLNTPLEVPPGMINLGPFRSIPSSVDSLSLKSQYLLAKCGTCLL